jgi:hydrogenase maturation protease
MGLEFREIVSDYDLNALYRDSSTDQADTDGATFDNKLVIIGIGNQYMKDDAVGLLVARELKKQEIVSDQFFIFEENTLDLSTLLPFKEARKVILVDTIKSGLEPGSVSEYTLTRNKQSVSKIPDLHSLQFCDILDLANQTKWFKGDLVLIGIEPLDCSVGEGISFVVRNAIPKLIEKVKEKTRM